MKDVIKAWVIANKWYVITGIVSVFFLFAAFGG